MSDLEEFSLLKEENFSLQSMGKYQFAVVHSLGMEGSWEAYKENHDENYKFPLWFVRRSAEWRLAPLASYVGGRPAPGTIL